ncbi:MAG: flagellar hook-length control protein FliK [Candidatus Aquicultor sp.]
MQAGGINLPGIKDVALIRALSNSAEGEVALKAGDIIQAKVIAASQESVILNIGGSRISASTNLSLSAGQMVALVVVEAGPEKVVLKQVAEQTPGSVTLKYSKADLAAYLLNDSGLKSSDVKNIAMLLQGSKIDTGASFAELEKLVSLALGKGDVPEELNLGALLGEIDELIVSAGDKQEIAGSLKTMAKAISHEANMLALLEGGEIDVSGLKASLLQSRSELATTIQKSPHLTSSGILSAVKESVEKVISVFHAVEALNLPVDQPVKGFIYLPLPVRLGENVGTAEVKIFKKGSDGKGGAQQSSVFTIGFALDMPALGKTRAWLEMADRFVSFSMALENIEAIRLAESMFGELKQSLEDMGYQVGKMSAAEIKEDSPISLIEEKLGLNLAGIDFKA